MKNSSLRLFLVAVFFGLAVGARAEDIPADLNGRLVALKGKSALPYSSPEIAQTKYFALYFSAGWCGPCHKFTPELVKFYHEMKPKYPGFEVVFMSHDESANAMEKYMAEMTMPWPALRYSVVKSSRGLTKYCGSGIPCLVVVNEKGEILSDSFEGKNYVGPYKVMNDLKKILADGPAAVAATSHPAAATTTSPRDHRGEEFGQFPERHELGRGVQKKAVAALPSDRCPRFAFPRPLA